MGIRRRWIGAVSALVAAASVLGGAGAASAAVAPYPSGKVGIDISYPSCHTKIPNGTPSA